MVGRDFLFSVHPYGYQPAKKHNFPRESLFITQNSFCHLCASDCQLKVNGGLFVLELTSVFWLVVT